MGSSGSKPRKPEQHHLPKVGSQANVRYEIDERRREVFHGWPLLVGAVLVLALLVGLVVITV